MRDFRLDSRPRTLVRGLAVLATFAAVALLLPDGDDPTTFWNEGPNAIRQLADDPEASSPTKDPEAPPVSSAAAPTVESPVAVNVYTRKTIVYSSNLFETDVFTRFGTGRVVWNRVVVDKYKFSTKDPGPCVAIGGHKAPKRWTQKDFADLAARYPHCMYMNFDDEKCKAPEEFDFRQYRDEKKPGGFYVPLSMRYDSWKTFQEMKKEEGFVIKKPSERRYAFNSMMSLSTSTTRQALARMLSQKEDERKLSSEGSEGSDFETYLELTEHWTAKFDTRSYLEVLLDSAFTLAPRGHHPECFRNYEAIEAGSIPVMIKEDLENSKCKNSMELWYEAPLLYLNDWEELYPRVEELMKDPERLDQMYVEVREWYEKFMKGRIVGMEDAVIDRYFGKEEVEATAE